MISLVSQRFSYSPHRGTSKNSARPINQLGFTSQWSPRFPSFSSMARPSRPIPTASSIGPFLLGRRLHWVAHESSNGLPGRLTFQSKEKSRLLAQITDPRTRHFTEEICEESETGSFDISADELTSIVEDQDADKLKELGGVEGIADKLSSSTSNGIADSATQLRSREAVYGVNKLPEPESKSFFSFLLEALQDTTLIVLGICAFVSLIVGIGTEGWPGGANDGLGIVASILLVVTVTATSNYRQSLQFRDLDAEKKKIPVQVTRNGSRQKISIYDILPGDVVHLAIGDQVPADGLFISGFSLLVNTASLTGESEPIPVNSDNPFLLSGTKVQDGFGKMLVTSVGTRTQWGKLVVALGEAGDDETPLQIKLNGVAGVIGKIGLFFAVLTFLVLISQKIQDGSVSSWTGEDVLEVLNYFAIAVTIVVVAVPEGLPLAVTLSLAFAMKKMMEDRALVRRLSACETMGSTTCICSDKTGTLTTNRMTVVKAFVSGRVRHVASPEEATGARSEIPRPAMEALLQSIFSNTSGEVVRDKAGEYNIMGSPTEASLLSFGMSLGGEFLSEKLVKVEPFNSTKKTMGVVIELPGHGFRAHYKGAAELVLGSCDRVIDSAGDSVPLDNGIRRELENVIKSFSDDALRTLCMAYREMDAGYRVEDEIPREGYTCIAILGIKDPVRPGVKDSVAVCRSAGIMVKMITGDNVNTAKAIAQECGILTEEGIVIEGPEFRRKTEEELQELVPKLQVLARSSPLDKLTLVKHLRYECKDVVAVTGDGTNDAPALREADIGLAMGICGTEVAKESSDVIIMDDNFSTVVTVAKWGRSVYVNIQKFVQFQLTVNVVALIVNFSSACLTGEAPLTAVQLLWVNMIMDTLGALALATEPPRDELMRRPPVGRNGTFISNVMWRNIAGQSLYQFIVIWYLQAEGKELFHLSGQGSDLTLNTLIFNTFIFCQVFNEISSRDMEKIDVLSGLFDNSVFVGVLSCTVIFQIVIVQFLGEFASTTPLDLSQWIACVLIGFLSMPVAAAVKFIPPDFMEVALHRRRN